MLLVCFSPYGGLHPRCNVGGLGGRTGTFRRGIGRVVWCKHWMGLWSWPDAVGGTKEEGLTRTADDYYYDDYYLAGSYGSVDSFHADTAERLWGSEADALRLIWHIPLPGSLHTFSRSKRKEGRRKGKMVLSAIV
jgi:hypothetical protein